MPWWHTCAGCRTVPADRLDINRQLSVNPPSGSLPLEVKVMNGGLITWTYAGPGAVPAGTVKRSSELETTVSVSPGPPKLATPPAAACAKKFTTAPFEKPVPSTVMVLPLWVTEVIVGGSPVGTKIVCDPTSPHIGVVHDREGAQSDRRVGGDVDLDLRRRAARLRKERAE